MPFILAHNLVPFLWFLLNLKTALVHTHRSNLIPGIYICVGVCHGKYNWVNNYIYKISFHINYNSVQIPTIYSLH